MAEDLFGRTFESIDVGMMADSLKGAVEQVVETSSPMTEEKLDNLYSAINVVAGRIDAAASQDLSSAQNFVDAVTTMDANIRFGSGGEKQEHQPQIAASLGRIDLATQVLARASKSRKVIVDRIATGAQRDIKKAILSAGCCGGIGKSSEAGQIIGAMKDVFDYQDVAQGTSEGVTKALEQYAASQPTGGGNLFGGGEDGLSASGGGKAWAAWFVGLRTAHKLLTIMSKQWESLFEISLKQMMPGLKGLNRWRETVRHIVFMQVGMGSLNRDLEADYRDIDIAVASTGVKRSQYAALLIQNLERGLVQEKKIDRMLGISLKKEGKQLTLDEKHQKVRSTQIKSMKSVTASAISTAELLNMGMDETNALFMDWHMHLSMSAAQIGVMGRNMLEVARQSGIIGTNLQNAMKTATEFAKKMRDAGQLGVGDVEQFTKIFSEFEQLGISDFGKEFVEGMIDISHFGDSKYKNLISVAAAMLSGPNMAAKREELGIGPDFTFEMMTGGFNDSLTNQRAMGVALEEHLRSWINEESVLSKALTDLGYDIPTMDMTQITQALQQVEDKGQALIRSGQTKLGGAIVNAAKFYSTNYNDEFGAYPEQVKRLAIAFERSSTTQEMSIDKVKAAIQKMHKDRMQGSKEYAAAVAEQARLELAAHMRVFSIIQEKASGPLGLNADAIDNILFDIRDKLGDTFADPLGELNTEDMIAQSDRLFGSIKAQAAALKFDVSGWLDAADLDEVTLKAALATGDPLKIEEVMRSLGYLTAAMDKEARAGQDPVTNLRKDLIKVSQELSSKLEELLEMILPWSKELFWLSMIATGIGALLAGTWLTKILYIFAGKQLKTLAQIPKVLGIAPKAGGLLSKIAPKAGGLLGKAGGLLGKVAGPAGVILSGILGGREAEAEDKPFVEGAGFGILTGSGTSKSMLGDLFGIKEGSGGDKALAITEAAAYGALIGSIFPVIGTAAGAVIGGLVKIIQMLGEKFQWVADIAGTIINPIGALIEGIWNILKGVWDILAGIVTLDFGRVLEGIKKIIWDGLIVGISKAVWYLGQGILKTATWIIQGIVTQFLNIPAMLGSLFSDFGPWLYGVILDGLTSLASSETFGPIFKPFLALWETIGEVIGPIFEPIGEMFVWIGEQIQPALDAVNGFFDSIREFFGIEKAAGGLEAVMDFLGGAFKILASILGFLIKWALFPIIRKLKMFGFIWKTVQFGIQKMIEVFMGVTSPLKAIAAFAKSTWKGIKDMFQYLYDYLIGNSLIPDLINGIIKWFKFLIAPFKMFWEGLKILGGVLGGVWQIIKGIFTLDISKIGGGLKKMFKSIWKGITAIPKMLWSAIFGGSEEGASGMAKFFGDIPGLLWDAFLFIPNLLLKALSGLGGLIWKVFKKAISFISLDKLKESFEDFSTWLYDMTIDALGQAWEWFKDKFNVGGALAGAVIGAAGAAGAAGAGALVTGAGALVVGAKAGAGAAKEIAKSTKSFIVDTRQGVLGNPDVKAAQRKSGATVIDQYSSVISIQNERISNEIGAAKIAEISRILESSRSHLAVTRRELLGYERQAGWFTDGLTGSQAIQADNARDQVKFLKQRIEYLERTFVLERSLLKETEKKTNSIKSRNNITAQELGAFERGGSQEAMMAGVSTFLAPQSEVEKLEKATQDYKKMIVETTSGTALVYGQAASEAAEKNIVTELSRASDVAKETSSERSESQQNIVAELSRALDYETQASEAAESGIIAETGAGVSPVGMDYSETIRPIVNPLMISRSHVENRLEQRRAEETQIGGSAAMLPSMDSISEYLSRIQAGKLDEMITLLSEIKIKMGESSTQTIGARGGGVPPVGRPGIKRIAQDYTRGHWDLTYGDSSPGSVTTDGGGN